MAEYIEREAVVQALRAEADKLKVGEADALAGLYTANCVIDGIPAAEVAPVRHGRWILEPTNPYDDPGYKNRMIKKCSVCHWQNACRYHYCPNCGAKMDEESEE